MGLTDKLAWYWEGLRNKILYNYYYYFPPRPTQMIFMIVDKESSDLDFVQDALGNSVFVEE